MATLDMCPSPLLLLLHPEPTPSGIPSRAILTFTNTPEKQARGTKHLCDLSSWVHSAAAPSTPHLPLGLARSGLNPHPSTASPTQKLGQAEGCWHASKQWTPQPFRPLREKELQEGSTSQWVRPPPHCCQPQGSQAPPPQTLKAWGLCNADSFHLLVTLPPPLFPPPCPSSQELNTTGTGWGRLPRSGPSSLALCPQCVAWIEQAMV